MNVQSFVFGSLVALVLGCGGGFRVQPINAYRAYEGFQPEQDKVVVAKAETIDANSANVRIFQEALPAGIVMDQTTFGVAPGYKHKLLGKFAYSAGKPTPKSDLVARVKRLTIAAGGDSAILIFLATDPSNYDVAQGVEAIVVHLDSASATEASPPEKPAAGTHSL